MSDAGIERDRMIAQSFVSGIVELSGLENLSRYIPSICTLFYVIGIVSRSKSQKLVWLIGEAPVGRIRYRYADCRPAVVLLNLKPERRKL
jgi:hypothetical protein